MKKGRWSWRGVDWSSVSPKAKEWLAAKKADWWLWVEFYVTEDNRQSANSEEQDILLELLKLKSECQPEHDDALYCELVEKYLKKSCEQTFQEKLAFAANQASHEIRDHLPLTTRSYKQQFEPAVKDPNNPWDRNEDAVEETDSVDNLNKEFKIFS